MAWRKRFIKLDHQLSSDDDEDDDKSSPPRDAYELTGQRLRQGHRQHPASSLRNRHLSGSGGVVAGPLLR